jgi:hypothetical protein
MIDLLQWLHMEMVLSQAASVLLLAPMLPSPSPEPAGASLAVASHRHFRRFCQPKQAPAPAF